MGFSLLFDLGLCDIQRAVETKTYCKYHAQGNFHVLFFFFFFFSIFRSLFFETNKTKTHVALGIVYIAGPYIVPNKQCDFKGTQTQTL